MDGYVNMSIFSRAGAVAAIAIVGCMPRYVAPPPAPARSATTVAASAGKTWESVIDVFTERHVPIRTMDRASGLIVAEPQRVDDANPDALADCGSMTNGGAHLSPTDAVWNVLVRGDSSASTVKATVRFSWTNAAARSTADARPGGLATKPCESRGVWESALEQRIKAAAEAKP